MGLERGEERSLEPRKLHAGPGRCVVADDELFRRFVPPEVDLDVVNPQAQALGQPGVVGTILRVAVMGADRERAGSAVRECLRRRRKCQQQSQSNEFYEHEVVL